LFPAGANGRPDITDGRKRRFLYSETGKGRSRRRDGICIAGRILLSILSKVWKGTWVHENYERFTNENRNSISAESESSESVSASPCVPSSPSKTARAGENGEKYYCPRG